MRNTISTILIITLMLLSISNKVFCFAEKDTANNYFTYTISNSEATITDVNQSIFGNISIPSTLGGYPVTKIAAYAFRDCSKLTSIAIPKTVSYIGTDAFYNCYALTAVHISDLKAWCEIEYSNCESNPLYYSKNLYINGEKTPNLIIPNDTKAIKSYAFAGCTSFTSITIPNSVTHIGNYSFYNCKSLTSALIPNSVTAIGSYAFYNCYGIKTVALGNKITQIDPYSFYSCINLTTVIFGGKITDIDKYAFYGCESLKDVWYKGSSMSDISISSKNFPLTNATWHCNVDVDGYHIYDNVCDAKCNVCNAVRTAPHVYNNKCDTSCNACNAVRSVAGHNYNKNHICIECGYVSFVPGDIDHNKGVTDSDAVYLLMHTFFPEDYPVNQNCDFNGDKRVTDADAKHLLMYTFFPNDYPLH